MTTTRRYVTLQAARSHRVARAGATHFGRLHLVSLQHVLHLLHPLLMCSFELLLLLVLGEVCIVLLVLLHLLLVSVA